MRGRAAPPYSGIYRVPPRDTIASPGFGLKQDLENRISWNMYGGPQVQRRNKKSPQNKFQLAAQQNKFAVK